MIDSQIRERMALLLESVAGDVARSDQLFQYVWSMVCVQHGLLRIVRKVDLDDTMQIVLEEVKTGNTRVVAKPHGIDDDVEVLAVRALDGILNAENKMQQHTRR